MCSPVHVVKGMCCVQISEAVSSIKKSEGTQPNNTMLHLLLTWKIKNTFSQSMPFSLRWMLNLQLPLREFYVTACSEAEVLSDNWSTQSCHR